MAAAEDVYCTMVLSDSYLPGAAVLAHSLRDSGTTKKLACLISQETLRASTVSELQSLYNYVVPIELIGNPHPANLYLMQRPDLLYSMTKIVLWRMTQWRKIVYIDADVVALRAPDELFEITQDFAAAPDVGWPSAFNSGVLVLSPDAGIYEALRGMAAAGDSFDGADQGLLNQYFEHKPWKMLNFTYNCTPSANYQYEPAYRYYKRDISLVHFIGKDKPWQQARSTTVLSSAHSELLSRWWAVYDRHFKVSTSDYISGQTTKPVSQVVQQEVRGETQPADGGYYATGYPMATTPPAPPPAPPPTSSIVPPARPFIAPTIEVQRFTPPQMEWDATRAPPPPESKPEAANFPTAIYEFNTDPAPFRPPPSYPEPPQNIHYEIPKAAPKTESKLVPIFPWEEREVPKATRTFVEDEPLPPPLLTKLEPEQEFRGADEFEVQAEDKPQFSPFTPTFPINDETPLEALGAPTKNAWDEITGIESYVRALTAHQKNRGKVQVLHQEEEKEPHQMHILSPSNEPNPEDLIETVQQRRESLILTDFPSAVERPSLPVTPAPRRRATFWGVEEDEEDQMPPAEGVPNQSDWDPTAQLEHLRRSSLDVGDLKLKAVRKIPDRVMPGILPIAEDAIDDHAEVPHNDSGAANSQS